MHPEDVTLLAVRFVLYVGLIGGYGVIQTLWIRALDPLNIFALIFTLFQLFALSAVSVLPQPPRASAAVTYYAMFVFYVAISLTCAAFRHFITLTLGEIINFVACHVTVYAAGLLARNIDDVSRLSVIGDPLLALRDLCVTCRPICLQVRCSTCI
ncbi:hypothetical protein C8R44DRAFT_770012 [Mycena epipterygia]|nr:hypothetical protein C8R44DRAFT_770012 [Mycena epipterygia]